MQIGVVHIDWFLRSYGDYCDARFYDLFLKYETKANLNNQIIVKSIEDERFLDAQMQLQQLLQNVTIAKKIILVLKWH